MSFEEFSKKLLKLCSEINVSLDEKQLKQFFQYLHIYKKWVVKINLSSIEEEEEIIQKHFADSLLGFSLIQGKRTCLDIGSGAGFPGIPLKIANPSLVLFSVDAKEKKVFFQKQVMRTLGFKKAYSTNIHIDWKARADLDFFLKGKKVDIILFRAIKPNKEMIDFLKAFLSENGKIFLYTGRSFNKAEQENTFENIYHLNKEIEHAFDQKYPRAIYSIC
ncbi:MAG: 16S rRNA (guanine(527)-N(7))-methyltransferase RsmG [Deltaproteobacteria bacterium]|nr:16S rRNA (guanine(527)-N(7))-methyltransferase RsmG [Deltaproteobacteria bacterium]